MPTDTPTQPTTRPVPADRDAPVDPAPSALASAALAVGIAADDVRAFLTSRYRFTSSDIGLVPLA